MTYILRVYYSLAIKSLFFARWTRLIFYGSLLVHLLKFTIKFLLVLIISQPSYSYSLGRWNTGETLLGHCNATLKLQDIDNPTPEDQTKSVACLSYLEGVKQLLYELNSFSEQKNICFPESGISNGQAARIVVNFSDEYPEKLHDYKLNFVLEAFAYAFPCK